MAAKAAHLPEVEQTVDDLLCSQHSQKLKWFSLEERRFLCDSCEDCNEDDSHTHCSIDDTAQGDLKRVLEILLEDLGHKLETLKDDKEACIHASEHIRTQAKDSEDKIKEEFAKLHQFLWDEEASRVAALREEEEQKSQVMKDRIDQISEEIMSLSETVKALAEQMSAQDAVPLQVKNIVAAGGRAHYSSHPAGGIGPSELVNVAKHLGNLRFHVWEKMQKMVEYTPVILDPNTADARLCITADMTSVKISADDESYQPPDNPERYDTFACALGSESWESGTHSWTVEVGANTSWEVGVSTGTGQRKGEDIWTGVWSVEFWDEEYYSRSPGQEEKTCLQVEERLQRIRVQLDLDAGELSFTDPTSGTCLLTVTHSFTEPVFPFLYNGCDTYPLDVLPARHAIATQD